MKLLFRLFAKKVLMHDEWLITKTQISTWTLSFFSHSFYLHACIFYQLISQRLLTHINCRYGWFLNYVFKNCWIYTMLLFSSSDFCLTHYSFHRKQCFPIGAYTSSCTQVTCRIRIPLYRRIRIPVYRRIRIFLLNFAWLDMDIV